MISTSYEFIETIKNASYLEGHYFYPRYWLIIEIPPLQCAQGRDITYSSPNLSKVIVALPSKIADDEFPEEFRHVTQKNVSFNNKCHEVSPSAQHQYHALQSFRCEKYIKMRTSSLAHSVICDTVMLAGNLLLANCLQCQLHKNEVFKGEFCNFNSSKPLLCQVCNPCSLPYYCSCRSFFSLENIIKKRWKNAKLHVVEHMD